MTQKKQLSILLFRWSSIGDVVLSTSALSYFKSFPIPHKIFWVCKEPALSLMRASYPEVEWIALSEVLSFRVLKILRACDAAIDMQVTLKSRFLSTIYRILFGKKIYPVHKRNMMRNGLIWKSRLLGRRAQGAVFPKRSFVQDVLQVCIQASALGQTGSVSAKPALFFPGAPNSVDSGKFNIGVAPGASYQTKKAPPELFAAVIEQISNHLGDRVQFFFLGDHADRDDAQKVFVLLKERVPIKNFCGSLSLCESARMIGQLDCVLGNDSSMGHIAEAQNVPSVVFFGPTVEAFGFTPYLSQSQAFSADLGCRPCSKHGQAPCYFKDKLCFQKIDSVGLNRVPK